MKKLYFTLLLTLMAGNLAASDLTSTENADLISTEQNSLIKRVYFEDAIQQTYESDNGDAHPIAYLPLEALCSILERVDPNEIMNILLTCKEWYNLAVDRKNSPNSLFNPLDRPQVLREIECAKYETFVLCAQRWVELDDSNLFKMAESAVHSYLNFLTRHIDVLHPLLKESGAFLDERIPLYQVSRSAFKEYECIGNGLEVFLNLFLMRLFTYNCMHGEQNWQDPGDAIGHITNTCESLKTSRTYSRVFGKLHPVLCARLLAINPFKYRSGSYLEGNSKEGHHWGRNGGIVLSIDLGGESDEDGHQDLIHDRGDSSELVWDEHESWETAEEGSSLEGNGRRAPVRNHLGVVEFYQHGQVEDRRPRQRPPGRRGCVVF